MANAHPQTQLNLIQVYRGIAAVLVLLHHTNIIFQRDLQQSFLAHIFDFGWAGVDFFFVLSGFIICYMHRSDIGESNKVKTFLLKRFVRIYPLYWVILAAKILTSWLLGLGQNTGSKSILEIFKAIILFPYNDFIGVSWTLSHEVFFYILFGLLILFGFRFMLPLIAIWAIGILINMLGGFSQDSIWNFVFNQRNIEFIFGCISAQIILKYGSKFKLGKFLVIIGSLLVLMSATVSFLDPARKLSPVFNFGIPLTLVVLGSVSVELNNFVKVPKILLIIGNASYSIYLLHGFFINNITKVFRTLFSKLNLSTLYDNTVAINIFGAITVFLSVFCGVIVYFYLEKPLLKYLRRNVIT